MSIAVASETNSAGKIALTFNKESAQYTMKLIFRFAWSYPKESSVMLFALVMAGVVEGIGLTALFSAAHTPSKLIIF